MQRKDLLRLAAHAPLPCAPRSKMAAPPARSPACARLGRSGKPPRPMDHRGATARRRPGSRPAPRTPPRAALAVELRGPDCAERIASIGCAERIASTNCRVASSKPLEQKPMPAETTILDSTVDGGNRGGVARIVLSRLTRREARRTDVEPASRVGTQDPPLRPHGSMAFPSSLPIPRG